MSRKSLLRSSISSVGSIGTDGRSPTDAFVVATDAVVDAFETAGFRTVDAVTRVETFRYTAVR